MDAVNNFVCFAFFRQTHHTEESSVDARFFAGSYIQFVVDLRLPAQYKCTKQRR